ncbi:universal stress protein [Subtercola boreus]|nr:universal stress protein [Subtercola boreus]
MSRIGNTLKNHPTESIVVGVDGSAPSRAAIRWSMHRAAATGSSVVLAHIVEDSLTVPPEHIEAKIQQTGNAFLQAELDFAHLVENHVPVTALLLQGDPLEQLAAASEHMVMVAVGTHKTGFVQGRVFGSKFIQLAARASSPVAFIPNFATRRRGGVVVGVGDVTEGQETIRFAAAEAARDGHDLTIVHCWEAPRTTTPRTPEEQAEATQFAALLSETVLADAKVVAGQAQPELSIRVRSVHRPAAEGLIDVSAAVSLLIIGRSHRNASLPGTVGSTVHDVLLNLGGPTVVIHDTLPIRRRTFAHKMRDVTAHH